MERRVWASQPGAGLWLLLFGAAGMHFLPSFCNRVLQNLDGNPTLVRHLA